MFYDKTNIGKRLLCIEFPGIVKNEDKVIETLGGLDAISTALDSDTKLHLKLRPEDAFCKPASSVIKKVSALLLKIKVKKKDKKIVSCTVVGHIENEHQFTSMIDFQYLPVINNDVLLGEIVPQDMSLYYFKTDAQLFLPPPVFTRSPGVQSYYYDVKDSISEDPNYKNLIGNIKRHRSSLIWCVQYDDVDIPTEPKKDDKKINVQNVEKVRALFEERPIWSKTGLKNMTGFLFNHLRTLLPHVAYYFATGPWRTLWVKLGYDPRKDPSAVIYQTLDFRMRNLKKSNIRRSRGTATQASSIVITSVGGSEVDANIKPETGSHIFVPGMVPSCKQMLLQFCDIHLPEVQNFFKNLPKPPDDFVLHDQNGWLSTGQVVDMRKILNQYAEESLRKQNEEQSCSSAMEDLLIDSSGDSDEDLDIDADDSE